MAEFCLDCWNQITNSNDPPEKYRISRGLELCEECNQWKPIIISERKLYYPKVSASPWFKLPKKKNTK